MEQLKSVTENLNIASDSIVDYTEDGSSFNYKPNYTSMVKAAVIKKLSSENLIEPEELSVKDKFIIPERPERKIGSKIIQEFIPPREIESTKSIIESSDSWYLAKEESGKTQIEERILDTEYLKGFTVSGVNIEEYLHEQLEEPLKQVNALDQAIKSVVKDEEDITKGLFLLSDQGKIIKTIFTAEELSSMRIEELNKYKEFEKLLREKSPRILPYIIENGDQRMLDTYLRHDNNAKDKIKSWRNQYN